MRKTLIILIIISIIFNNFLIHISLGQEGVESQEGVENQETINFVDFSPYKAYCKFEKIEFEEVAPETTETLEYVSELEHFAGKSGKAGVSSLRRTMRDIGRTIEAEIKGVIVGTIKSTVLDIIEGGVSAIIKSAIGGIFGGIFGRSRQRVVIDPETKKILKMSIRESIKNVLANIRTSVQLAVQDSQEYLKFQLLNKLNEIMYGKVLKNFITNIEAYKNLRLFTAYQRAYNKISQRYKDLPCLPEEVKGCLSSLINDAYKIAEDYALRSENPEKLAKFLNYFYKLQTITIVEKESCGIEERDQIYKALQLTKPIISNEIEANYTSLKKPEKYVAKVDSKKLSGGLASIFANLKDSFKKINMKRLTAQIFPEQVPQDFFGEDIFFDIYEPVRTQINIGNCLAINDSFATQILKDLQKEEESLQMQIQQPGGLTFKPKTQCLKTWAEIEFEETYKALEISMNKGDMKEIERLQKKYAELQQKIDSQKDISGEDPNCLIPGPTLSSPSDYQRLKDQLLTSPLEFFKSEEKATNVLVAFTRSWLASKLFKIIDKGFASLEAKSSSNYYYLADIKSAYAPERINKICEETRSTDVPAIYESCKAALESQLKKITNIERKNIRELQDKTLKVFSRLNVIKSELDNLNASTTALQDWLNNYSQYLSSEKLDRISEILYEFRNLMDSFDLISKNLINSSSSLETFLNQETFAQIASTSNSYEEKINALDSEVQTTTAQVEKITNDVEQVLSPIAEMVTDNIISTFFEGYFDLNKMKEPSEYIAYRDKDGNFRQIGMFPSYFNCAPGLGNKTKLLFSEFYPTHVKDCLYNLNDLAIEYRFDTSTVFANGTNLTGATALDNDSYYSIYFIIHDLIYILYSLYNSPISRGGSQQLSFISATYEILTNLTNLDISEIENLESELDKAYEYFDALEKYTSSTINYATKKGGILDKEFAIAKTRNGWTKIAEGEAIVLKMGVVLNFLLKIAKGFKEAIDIYRQALKDDKNFFEKIKMLAEKEKERDELIKEMDSELQELWQQVVGKMDAETLQSISNSIDQNLEKVNDQIESLNNLCETYNDLIEEIEGEINKKIQAEQENQPELPTEEMPSESKIQTTKFSIVQRTFGVIKGLLANVFSFLNIFKPKKIYIK